LTAKPNFLVIYCDQLRADGLGCYGSPAAATPSIDRLAADGVIFENHYASNQVCMPSRASFFTGQHPQAHGVIDNGIALRACEPTLPGVLGEAGYRTHSVGKIHLTPYRAAAECDFPESYSMWASGRMDGWTGPYYGFESVALTLGHGEGTFQCGGHYGRWVSGNFDAGSWKLGAEAASGPKVPELACWRSNLPVEAHHSTWVADRAVEFLRGAGDRPFFLFASLPDPHHPFTPPVDYAARFDPAAMPAPNRREGENDRKPAHYRRAMTQQQHPTDGGAHRPPAASDEALRLVSAHYHASIALIDDSVGRILGALESSGLAENTVVVFTADHGELLGDHWMMFKGPYPCRALLRVPMIVRAPGGAAGRAGMVTSNTEVMATLLEAAGVAAPATVQGRSFRALLDDPRAACGDGGALSTGWSKDSPEFYHKTLYTDRWRVSWFPNQSAGELYDLEADPHELANLFDEPAHRATRDRLMADLLRRAARADTLRPPAVAPW
jgi:arylsulfatase